MAKNTSRNGRELEPAEGNWLISYADMMTGLVLLFILLFVMTAFKAKGMVEKARAEASYAEAQLASVKASIHETASTETEQAKQAVVSPSPKSDSEAKEASSASGSAAAKKPPDIKETSPSESSQRVSEELYKYLSPPASLKALEHSQTAEGIKFVIQADLLFESGSSRLKPESYALLNEFAAYFKSLGNSIVISGHTDNVPIGAGDFQSNWELSCDRAVKVLRYFTDYCSLSPGRFVAIGYGEYKPAADNGTESGRSRNNRVEILVVQK